MRGKFRIGLAVFAACGALAAVAASAEPAGGLAPAGDCAEPRLQVRGEPLGIPPVEDDGGVETFPVAGSPRDHFDPRDVAATRGADPRDLPPAPPAFERTACDAPGAVCLGAVSGAPPGGVISEPTPGTPDQPGAGPLR